MLITILRADLAEAMRAGDTIRTTTLQRVLAAIYDVDVSGQPSQTLSEAQVVNVLHTEAHKKLTSAAAFASSGRDDLSQVEHQAHRIITQYLPVHVSREELDLLIGEAFAAGMLTERRRR